MDCKFEKVVNEARAGLLKYINERVAELGHDSEALASKIYSVLCDKMVTEITAIYTTDQKKYIVNYKTLHMEFGELSKILEINI